MRPFLAPRQDGVKEASSGLNDAPCRGGGVGGGIVQIPRHRLGIDRHLDETRGVPPHYRAKAFGFFVHVAQLWEQTSGDADRMTPPPLIDRDRDVASPLDRLEQSDDHVGGNGLIDGLAEHRPYAVCERLAGEANRGAAAAGGIRIEYDERLEPKMPCRWAQHDDEVLDAGRAR